ncbi:MAG TPA: methylmalonyl Co-A mutase-associated GTPase MeaB, partial [Desulfosarcina sp.]|nr:methylmalonyl Co-A mutase-associated GTPase MeaB [Desulfosarcina sp.]
QGIKKGVLELADAVAVNKADGDNLENAAKAQRAYEMALHLLNPATPTWTPPVLTCSALTMAGVDTLWATVQDHRRRLSDTGELAEKRRRQALAWMWSRIEDGLRERFFGHPAVSRQLRMTEAKVARGELSAIVAAEELLFLLDNGT